MNLIYKLINYFNYIKYYLIILFTYNNNLINQLYLTYNLIY